MSEADGQPGTTATASPERRPLVNGRAFWSIRLIPFGIFILLLTLTLVVTRQELLARRALRTRHTEDVCLQSSRRLEVFVDSRLNVAEIFARRWSTHETRDYSRQRFEEFGSVILNAVRGYQAIALILPDRRETWVIPHGVGLAENQPEQVPAELLDEAAETGRTVISPPIMSNGDEKIFLAVLPLRRDGEDLGSLVAFFNANTLIDDCFHHRIRREFDFEILDGDQTLYRFAPEGNSSLSASETSSSQTFEVGNRLWVLTMAPREPEEMVARLGVALPIFLLGLLLSLGMTWLIHLLQIRIQLLGEARDRAMHEMSAREAAQQALEASEARYRSVFDSATDGLVIANREGVILESNESACALHGRSAGALRLTLFTQLLHRDSRHLWEELLRQLDDKGTARLEARHITVDGDQVDIELGASQLDKEDDDRLLLILTDITERKRSEQRHAQLSRTVLAAQEEERGRISRELHDELGQLLTALRLEMGWLRKKASLSKDQEASFDGCVGLVETAADQLRLVCRGLRPPLLDDLGLEPAVQHLVNDFADRSGLVVDFQVELDETDAPLPKEVALCAYRILQESLTNVSRHAEATKTTVSLSFRRGRLFASVSDDGQGFEVSELGSKLGCCGVAGMLERANLVRGTVEIRSTPGEGTEVVFEAPI
jgi:PAS domain S-box-containing protein